MRASRLLTTMFLLQARGRLSAVTLARELEVSVRTVYRDIDDLGAAGVPVYAERGRNGGFALLGGFRTNLTGLTAREADAVSLIGVAQAAADLGLGDGAAAARLKVIASLPPGTRGLAEAVATRFHLDPAPWYKRLPLPPALRPLAEAVWAGRHVRATYESWKGVGRRNLAPLGLVMKAGAWYLVGAAGKSTRIYRVAGIQDLEVTDEPVRRPRHFDLARSWERATREFETQLHSETARVRLSARGLRLLQDVSPAAAVVVAEQGRAAKGAAWIEARIPFERLPHAVHEALRMGAEMEVLEPPELRAAVAAAARRIAALHRPRKA